MLVLLLLLPLLKIATTDVYSSFEGVKNLNHIEDHLVTLLGEYLESERVRLNTLETFRQYVLSGKSYTDPERYISYPTNQFNVIHRFAADWNNLKGWMDSRNQDMVSAYDSYESHFPNQDDVKGAIRAIHRLQDIYKIKASQFARGDPVERESGTSELLGQPFNVKALYVFTKNAYENQDWNKCSAWAQQAFHLMQDTGEYLPDHSMWFDVADHFSFCLYKAGNVEEAMEITDTMLLHYPTHERLLSNKAYFQETIQASLKEHPAVEKRSVVTDPTLDMHEIGGPEDVEITFVPKKYPGADQVVLDEKTIEDEIEDKKYVGWSTRVKKYRKLCKEAPPLSPQMAQQVHQLQCYIKQDTPRSILQPIKVEVAWPSPRILIFHDFMNDEEADFLMSLALPMLNRATVHNKETGKLENAEYRVSKTAWLDMDLPADKNKVVRRVNRRMEDATELSHDYAELQQVNNYGIGGQYEPHYDMATKEEKAFTEHDGGNRVATLLFYMGNTDAGGATVFVDAGARLAPQKNSAVFWYNLLPNGNPDLLTRHAGCPVLAGTKWVMNKWFHVNDQVFTRPCDLDENRREKPAKLYNGRYTV